MRIEPIEPPRTFSVGRLRHVADVWLGDNELVTLRAGSGSEYDLTRTSWGYYATPSVNQRLAEHGLRTALCLGLPRAGGTAERLYVMLVERGAEPDFEAYLAADDMRVVAWLDSDEAVAAAVAKLERD
jgi:hypothetical protein